MKRVVTRSEEETREVGRKLWGKNKRFFGKQAVVFALEGELGTGKTQLTKGLARAMGVKDEVISPTFTLEAEYDLGKLVHIDAWRLEESKELLEIGFLKRVEDKKVVVIEWADRVGKTLEKIEDKTRVVRVTLRYGENKNERIIEIK